MSDKDISNHIKKDTPFDDFIGELDIGSVHRRYVERVVVYYEDGSKMAVPKTELPELLLSSNYNSWLDYKYKLCPIADVKIFIDTLRLEKDVNKILQLYWSKFT